MARKPTARVVMNRAALDQVTLAVADGALAVAEHIVRSADPPDATPYGEGLVTNGGWLAYVGPNKVGGGGLDGKQPKKPRSLQVRGTGDQIHVIGGFGFPARFQEEGTVNHPAQPFLTPMFVAGADETPGIVKRTVDPQLRRIP